LGKRLRDTKRGVEEVEKTIEYVLKTHTLSLSLFLSVAFGGGRKGRADEDEVNFF